MTPKLIGQKIPPAAVAWLMLGMLCLLSVRARGEESTATNGDKIIDDCQYTDNSAASAAWRPTGGTSPVMTSFINGRNVLLLPCKFVGNDANRSAWDRKVTLDLSSARGIRFDFLCRKTLPVSYFSVYLQSGPGWYHAVFFPDSTNWNTITIDRSEMQTEGKPEGWNHIKAIRIAAYRSGNENTELFLSDIRETAPAPKAGTREAAQEAIDRIGKVASYRTFDEAGIRIINFGEQDDRVVKAFFRAKEQRHDAIELIAKGDFSGATVKAGAANDELKRAFCAAQRPVPDEFRAFWCHSAFGVPGMSWDEAIHRLADNGFTAIIPNMLSAGAAFYDSKVLPKATSLGQRGDQIRECLAACKKYGIKMYVWKLDWNIGGSAPKEFIEKMRQAHRLQASATGKEELWLCPSDPDNQKLEIDAMLEIVRNYDVDGVHFDYIRYPDGDHCFCDRCKERFQHTAGIGLKNWPADVLEGGALRQQWLDWRRSNITTVVKAVSEQARAIKPNIQLSAAVFRYWSTDRDTVGQDWKIWCDKGYLDFVCPMDYTPSTARLSDMVTQQVEWAGKARCYPGLGVSSSSSHFGVDRAIEEISVTRAHNTHGFVIFNYGANEAKDLLPMLGMGITRKTP